MGLDLDGRIVSTLPCGVTQGAALGGTLCHQIVNVAARLARLAHGIDLHLPESWPWTGRWQLLFGTTPRPAPT